MNAAAILAILAYFLVAAYHGKASSALKVTAEDGLGAAWFLAGGLALAMLRGIDAIRRPVDIFIALVVASAILARWQQASAEMQAAYDYLAGAAANAGGSNPQFVGLANNPASVVVVPGAGGGGALGAVPGAAGGAAGKGGAQSGGVGGALAGAAAGASAGAAVGPIGAVVGGAIGAIAGGLF